MVLESKFNFIYSIDTKNYGYLYPKIESNKKYPIFIYSKEYEVDIDSFENAFPSISSAKSFKTYFLAFGIVFIIILAVVSVFLIYRYVKYTRKRIKIDVDRLRRDISSYPVQDTSRSACSSRVFSDRSRTGR